MSDKNYKLINSEHHFLDLESKEQNPFSVFPKLLWILLSLIEILLIWRLVVIGLHIEGKLANLKLFLITTDILITPFVSFFKDHISEKMDVIVSGIFYFLLISALTIFYHSLVQWFINKRRNE